MRTTAIARRFHPPLLLLAALAAVRPLAGQELEKYDIDKGLLYVRYSEEGLIAHVLKVDLRIRSFHLRSVKAKGKETIHQLVDRMNDDQTRVLAGINGDFFRQETRAGLPYGVQVSDGKLIFAPMKRSMICFTPANEPYIGIVGLSAKVTFLPKAKRPALARWTPLDGVNVLDQSSIPNGIYLYTPAFLDLNYAHTGGVIAVVESIQPALQVGDVCEGTIARVEMSDKPTSVPETGCILYFSGTQAMQAAAQVSAGQPVALRLDLPPFGKRVSQAIGGGPRLVSKGKVTVEIAKEAFDSMHAMDISRRNPRSAIGYDKTLQNLFLVMVEGRHDDSRGMTFDELGKFLVKLGCWEGMAFDGGGSSGLYVAGKGLVSKSMGGFNQPEERAVANGLLITVPKSPSEKKSPAKDSSKPAAKDAPKPAGKTAPGEETRKP
jgi:phosphodiester glycosidase